jgi:hypothetical protein
MTYERIDLSVKIRSVSPDSTHRHPDNNDRYSAEFIANRSGGNLSGEVLPDDPTSDQSSQEGNARDGHKTTSDLGNASAHCAATIDHRRVRSWRNRDPLPNARDVRFGEMAKLFFGPTWAQSGHCRDWPLLAVSGTSGFGRENAASDIRFASPRG